MTELDQLLARAPTSSFPGCAKKKLREPEIRELVPALRGTSFPALVALLGARGKPGAELGQELLHGAAGAVAARPALANLGVSPDDVERALTAVFVHGASSESAVPDSRAARRADGRRGPRAREANRARAHTRASEERARAARDRALLRGPRLGPRVRRVRGARASARSREGPAPAAAPGRGAGRRRRPRPRRHAVRSPAGRRRSPRGREARPSARRPRAHDALPARLRERRRTPRTWSPSSPATRAFGSRS